MLAIYKRELKSYLTSMVGYLFMFFVLLIAGIYFSAYQLSAAYPKFEYTLNAMTFVFLIAVPILTMRVLAEERKQKTDQLLLTAPVSLASAVLGKYFAMLTVFAAALGKAICAIPLPQCIILLCVFGAGRLLAGVLTPEMFADLSGCGGVLTMAAGFRVSKIKSVPLVDLMPALILVMPLSLLWTILM